MTAAVMRNDSGDLLLFAAILELLCQIVLDTRHSLLGFSCCFLCPAGEQYNDCRS